MIWFGNWSYLSSLADCRTYYWIKWINIKFACSPSCCQFGALLEGPDCPRTVEAFCLNPPLSLSFYCSCYWAAQRQLKLHPRKLGSQHIKLWHCSVWEPFCVCQNPSFLFLRVVPILRVHQVQSCFLSPRPGPGVWNHHFHRPEATGAQHRVHRDRRASLPRDGGQVAVRKREDKWVQMSLLIDL